MRYMVCFFLLANLWSDSAFDWPSHSVETDNDCLFACLFLLNALILPVG